MENNNMINVLWIDDQPSDPFMDSAFNDGINIENCLFLDDAIKRLNDVDVSWDAIILDANCKIHSRDEAPDIGALTESINALSRLNKELPWFVYTAGGYQGEDSLKHIIPKEREWDDRQYYKKPSEMDDLFSNLKKAASNRYVTKVKRKYKDVCSFYKEKDLVDILVACENDDSFDRNHIIPNSIRQILDWVMVYCNEVGVLQVKFNNSNLNECSREFGKSEMEKFLPVYVQRSFHSCVTYANSGSHRYTDIIEDIRKGDAPYLNRSAVHDLLNILVWCKGLPVDEGERQELSNQVKSLFKDTARIIAEGEVCCDTNGVYYCGENHSLYPGEGKTLLGKTIKILSDKDNTSRSKTFYKKTVTRYQEIDE